LWERTVWPDADDPAEDAFDTRSSSRWLLPLPEVGMNGGGNADASDINASVVVLIADDDAKEPKWIFVIQFVRSCSEVQANVTTISAPCKPRQKRTLETVFGIHALSITQKHLHNAEFITAALASILANLR
jgi:hypothetical protein